MKRWGKILLWRGAIVAFLACSFFQASARATLPGAEFPACWAHEFQVPDQINKGEPFRVTIRVRTTLFPLEKVSIVPFVSGRLKLVESPRWAGTLPAGEYRDMTLTMVATSDGFNGTYGLIVEAPEFYNTLAAYVQRQKEGEYAGSEAKADILGQIENMKNVQPVYQDMVSSSISLTPSAAGLKDTPEHQTPEQ